MISILAKKLTASELHQGKTLKKSRMFPPREEVFSTNRGQIYKKN